VKPSDNVASTTRLAAGQGYRREIRAPSAPAAGSEADAVLRRFKTSRLRPTTARAAVLVALEQAAPRCLDATQVLHLLLPRFEHLSPATIYRALNDLWGAGMLLRHRGQQGRAHYAIKPGEANQSGDIFSCQCGKQMILVEDGLLHEQLRVSAEAAGFDINKKSTFTISLSCTGCGHNDTGR